ncbi:MAG: GTPase HflX, partial [Bacteroidales bacterium]|nr:GTPase HflX [Bacteroidales bacterium]
METAVLVAVISDKDDIGQREEYLDELAFLAETAGIETKKRFMQRLSHPLAGTYLGSGKLKEMAEFVKENEIDYAIFDDELSPTQIRNIEKDTGISVMDRTGLILEIFAQRAKTAYAKTQVELAQYQYLYPRLTGMWTHLERQ